MHEENASKGLPNAIFELQDSNGKVLKSGIKTKANGETDEIQLSKQLDKTVFDLYVKYKLVETTTLVVIKQEILLNFILLTIVNQQMS
ncbi:MAG: hypothetical protein ACLURP_02685 [Ruminococcus sp.]